MHKLVLKRILISNFKGIKEVDLIFDSENNSIKGNTKIGKSSIYDAFTFLLFGTDSLKTSRFDVLPTITDGIDRIASVDAEFNIWHNDSCGGNITLKRIYKPTKNGGSTSKYFIDDKNVSKTVYYKRVTDDVFAGDVKMANILSSPTYFFEKLTNEEQRAFVLNVIGEVSIDSIIEDHPKFASILELKNDTITERQKFVREKNRLNGVIKNIPEKIEENFNLLQKYEDIQELNENDLTAKRKKIEDEIEDLQRMVSQSSDQQARDQEILLKKSEISKIDERLNKHLNKDFQEERVFEQEKDEKLSEIRKSLRQKSQECRKIDDKIDGITSSREKKLQDKKKELKQAKDIYSAIGKEYLALKKNYKESPTICYACKQQLPEDTLVKRDEDFKKQTAEIEKKGKQAATKCRALEEQFNEISKESTVDSEEMLNLKQERERIEKEVRTLKGKCLDIEKTAFKTPKNEDRKALEEEKDILLDELINLKNKPLNISESVKKYRKDIENKKAESQKLTADISRFKPMQDIQKRIKDLNDKKAALIKQVNDVEKWISLIDDFNNIQADILERPINEHLQIGEFSLFETLVSGGLAPSCTMKVDGVSYHSLNSTTKVNVGLSFINAISIKAGIKMPVWIDGAESYQGLINLDTQFFSIEVLVDNVSEIQENIPDFNHKAFGNNMIVNGKDVGNILWVKD